MISSVFQIGITLAFLFGWVLNIFTIVQTLPGQLGGMFVMRVIGIFVFPIGSILGWI